MHFFSIHVIAECNQAGSEIICRQIIVLFGYKSNNNIELSMAYNIGDVAYK